MKQTLIIIIFSLLLAPFIGSAQVSRSAYAGVTILSASEFTTATITQRETSIASLRSYNSTKGIFNTTEESIITSKTEDASIQSDFNLTATGANAFNIVIEKVVTVENTNNENSAVKGLISVKEISPAFMDGTTFIVKVDASLSFVKNTSKGSFTTQPFNVILNQE